MNTSNGEDDRGDWIRPFMSEEDFKEVVKNSDRFIQNSMDGIHIPIAMSYNDCIQLVQQWHKALAGDSLAQFHMHNLLATFVVWVQDMLIEDGIDWREGL